MVDGGGGWEEEGEEEEAELLRHSQGAHAGGWRAARVCERCRQYRSMYIVVSKPPRVKPRRR